MTHCRARKKVGNKWRKSLSTRRVLGETGIHFLQGGGGGKKPPFQFIYEHKTLAWPKRNNGSQRGTFSLIFEVGGGRRQLSAHGRRENFFHLGTESTRSHLIQQQLKGETDLLG